MGIIAAGTLLGLFAFKERISRVNWLGISLGIIAIILMTMI
jgi:multidrug transporter EmrE-like cation transporter